MSGVKITELPAANDLDEANAFEVVQGGQSRKMTGQQLKAAMQAVVNRTVSTSAPTGVPADGAEWVVIAS